jgi:hypothetical protein
MAEFPRSQASLGVLNTNLMRASSVILTFLLLLGCASNPSENALRLCVRDFPPDTLPALDQWASVSRTSTQVLKLREAHPVNDAHSYWFATAENYLLLCRNPRHYQYGDDIATVFIPDGADWKVNKIVVILD